MFKPYGTIKYLSYKQVEVKNAGFAIIGYEENNAVTKAITNRNGFNVGDKVLIVEAQKSEEERKE